MNFQFVGSYRPIPGLRFADRYRRCEIITSPCYSGIFKPVVPEPTVKRLAETAFPTA